MYQESRQSGRPLVLQNYVFGSDRMYEMLNRYNIHKKAVDYQRKGEYDSAEKTYRDARFLRYGISLGFPINTA